MYQTAGTSVAVISHSALRFLSTGQGRIGGSDGTPDWGRIALGVRIEQSAHLFPQKTVITITLHQVTPSSYVLLMKLSTGADFRGNR